MKTLRQDFATILALLSMLGPTGVALAQAGGGLDGASPPANGVWVDSLDLSKAMGGRPPRPGLAAFGGRPALVDCTTERDRRVRHCRRVATRGPAAECSQPWPRRTTAHRLAQVERIDPDTIRRRTRPIKSPAGLRQRDASRPEHG